MRRWLLLALPLLALTQSGLQCTPNGGSGTVMDLPGLQDEVRVVTDRYGVPHIFAHNDLDLFRVQGWIQARDRMWQLDVTRRQVDGTLAELLGPSQVNNDIQMRTIGLQRAAARSLAALDPQTRAVLDAFAAGVNAWLDQAEATGTLPPEYAQIEITHVRRWDPVDTVGIGKGLAASLSLDIDAGHKEDLQRFVDAGTANGFDGRALFFEDIDRVAPMDPASTVPDATGTVPWIAARIPRSSERLAALGRAVRERALANPFLAPAVDRRHGLIGSNEWGVAAEHTTTGTPIYANDPHLHLGNPATFHEVHLADDDPVNGPLNIAGVSVPGAPLVVQGQNEHITFGSTTNPMDVTDIFDDELVVGDPSCTGARLMCIRSEGTLHPVDFELATYLVNQIGDGVNDNLELANIPLQSGFIFTVPFRNDGPIVDVTDPNVILSGSGTTRALVLQFTGFSATLELETFRIWARAHDLATFKQGLQDFDFGSQNWGYADADGNLAIFTSGELPLRRDLEAGGDPACPLPPSFVRPGDGPCNWIEDPAHSQGQTIPFAVMPFSEMPQTENPANGFFVNANNDPAGVCLDNNCLNQHRPSDPKAIYYLSDGYDKGLRAGRITRLVRGAIQAGQKISVDDMKRFQGNTQELDAQLLVPFLLTAWQRATQPGAPAELAALAADPELAEAVSRLSAWDFSTPTGIPEGYDHTDTDGVNASFVPSYEAKASVAATIYNVWRAKAIRQVVDATLSRYGLSTGSGQALVALYHVLSQSPFTGVGASGVDFFPAPVTLSSAADRRDATLLGALRTALDALASNDFKDAFANSTSQDDYRWGRLHRITFDHPLGTAFQIPPTGGFSNLSAALPGIPRDGGYDVVNASGFSARADRQNDFRFGGGPNRRYVGAPGTGVRAGADVTGFEVIPGGRTAREDNVTYDIELPTWLTADYHPLEMFEDDARRAPIAVETFRPPTP